MPGGSKPKPTLCIAGPGAGKTFGMVQLVVDTLPRVSPNRFVAVITYTNSAVDLIRSQFMKVAKSPRNLFIGTNHAFLNHFVLDPYGQLLGKVPSERHFADVDLTGFSTVQAARSPKDEAIARRKIVERLVKRGVIPFDELVRLSADLMDDKRVRAAVANRLQVLFIDEFQDLDTSQLRVIETIRKAGKTEIHVVGDPEQYISGFVYTQKRQKVKAYTEIPFFKFGQSANVQYVNVNRRSCGEIVRFTNNFHSCLQQVWERPSTEDSGVFFMEPVESGAIMSAFRSLADRFECCAIEQPDRPFTRLVLARDNRIIDAFADDFQLTYISNDRSKPRSTLDETLKLITSAVGQNPRQLGDTQGMTRLELRKAAIKLMKRIKYQEIHSKEDILQEIAEAFHIEIPQQEEPTDVENRLFKLQALLAPRICDESTEMCSTIHKAKGLEADSVLVIATTNNELAKWITRDVPTRNADKRDDCRIGYVAFTRARSVLCIACLEKLNSRNRAELALLGVQFYSENDGLRAQLALGV